MRRILVVPRTPIKSGAAEGEAMAKIFVSYTSKDAAEAAWIARELRRLGHTPFLHEAEIKGGESFMVWMGPRMDEAEHTLCLMSPEYFTAEFSQREYNAALTEATRKGSNFLLPVVVRPCDVPKLVADLNRCTLHNAFGDEKLARFHAFINKSALPDVAPASKLAAGTALSNIPIRVPEHFLGRDDTLAEIHTALGQHQGRVAITALHGLRGVGKTVLAAAYAERHAKDYRATWWIRAETESGMRADLVGLGVRLGWVDPEEKEEPALAAVRERLVQEGDGLLLIYDNAVAADGIRPYLPRGGAARVLVTSNAHAWRGIAEPVEIRLWPKEIGAEFLIRRTGRTAERAAAEALSEALGGLPLAHEQAAAYCETLGVGFAEYRKRYAAEPVALMDDPEFAPAEYHDRLTAAKTFALAIDAAAKLHPAAEQLIVHAALLAPEPIPLFLFSEGRKELGEPVASALAGDGLDKAVAALRAFALIDRETIADARDPATTTDTIRLHRLVREVAAVRAGHAREAILAALIGAMATAYPHAASDGPPSWPRARRLDPLALALVEGDSVAAPQLGARLLERLAVYRHASLGDYAEGKDLCERWLALAEREYGADDPQTSAAAHTLAIMLRDQGNLGAARPLFERSLAIDEKFYGEGNPNRVAGLTQFANLLRRMGDLPAAQKVAEQALRISETNLGPDHRDTANCLLTLAMITRACGKIGESLPMFRRVVETSEKTLGRDHPDTATALGSLAFALWDTGDWDAARSLLERALAIFQNVLGPEHPTTVSVRNNLARLTAGR
jgi:tetratricopeptide (TPR) repeat protein